MIDLYVYFEFKYKLRSHLLTELGNNCFFLLNLFADGFDFGCEVLLISSFSEGD